MANQTLPTPRAFMTALLESLPTSASTNTGASTVTTPSNPLSLLPEPARKKILTLHVLFPNEFLPALDLLDRRLVTRFRIRSEQEKEKDDGGMKPRGEGESSPILHGRVEKDQQVGAREDSAPTLPPAPASVDLTGGNTSGSKDVDVEMQDATEDTSADQTSPNPEPIYYVRSAQHRTSRHNTSYDHITHYEVRLHAWNCSCPAFAFAAFPSVHPEEPVLLESPSEYKEEGSRGVWSFGGVRLGTAMPPVCKHLLACLLVERCERLFGGFVEERDVSIEEAAGWAAGWGD